MCARACVSVFCCLVCHKKWCGFRFRFLGLQNVKIGSIFFSFYFYGVGYNVLKSTSLYLVCSWMFIIIIFSESSEISGTLFWPWKHPAFWLVENDGRWLAGETTLLNVSLQKCRIWFLNLTSPHLIQRTWCIMSAKTALQYVTKTTTWKLEKVWTNSYVPAWMSAMFVCFFLLFRT